MVVVRSFLTVCLQLMLRLACDMIVVSILFLYMGVAIYEACMQEIIINKL